MEFIPSFLSKERKEPLYSQLYNHLVQEIHAGGITTGERLPGKRTAASQLGVSVNTVDEAYQMLAAEGYVEARPRSGFVVCRLERQQVPPPLSLARAAWESEEEAASTEAPRRIWRHSFFTGDLDPALFPHKTWNRLFREVLASDTNLFLRGEGQGEEVLRRAIADYLRGLRGVQCEAGQIVVGAGLEVLVGMLARLFAGEVFAVEDPGYPKTGHILHNMGVEMRAVPVDAEGMPPHRLEESGASIAYLTPSHQFPTGAVMPVGRRTELLQWAAAGHRLLVEDDFDSEFRFDGRPLPSLQGLDTAGRVVYAGTFSRALAPGLRAAYLVLPPALLERWRRRYRDYACTVSRPEQHTLARLMSEGHFARSLNRVRAAYRQRRQALLSAVEAVFPAGCYRLENRHTGLYFVLRLPGRDAMALAESARREGLGLRALDEYRNRHPENHPVPTTETADALVVGYGGLAPGQAENAAAALAGVLGLLR